MLTSYYASKLLDPNRHYLVRVSVGAPRYCKHRVESYGTTRRSVV